MLVIVKIIAAAEDDVWEDGIWYTSEGEEIGPEIWGAFAIIFEVENDIPLSINEITDRIALYNGIGYWN